MGFWINEIPTLRFREEPKRRVYWITRDEAARLINALPDHIVPMAESSLPTGLRLANVTRIHGIK